MLDSALIKMLVKWTLCNANSIDTSTDMLLVDLKSMLDGNALLLCLFGWNGYGLYGLLWYWFVMILICYECLMVDC